MNENEVRMIAQRQRVPDIVACAIGSNITQQPARAELLDQMFADNERRTPIGMAIRNIAPAIRITRNDRRRLTYLLGRLEPHRASSAAGFLNQELSRAEIMADDAIDPTVVTMRSRVLYEHNDNRRMHTATLIYPGDFVQPRNAISILSPPASALLGLAEGKSMHWRQGRQWHSVTVMRVLYQPEACGRTDW